ncbi:MAG: daunorubicin ABC transporter permease, partial [Candidatus Eremiobacteraeota bacterium]|nr:daunorubicin ABC transporter permease [Candidatus Eremiobacteraeota bacterium]
APLSIYIGKVAGSQIAAMLGFQVFWATCFGVLAIALWRIGERRVVIQGG